MTHPDASVRETAARRILVTGGSGFIGTNLVRYLNERGATNLNFDRRPPPDSNLAASWKPGDVGDLAAVMAAIKKFGPSHVIHLAARTDLNGTGLEDYADNLKGADNIIKAVNQVGGVNRIIFASSMLVSTPGRTPAGLEDCTPATDYGKSKLAMEKLICGAEIKTEWLIVRPTSIWGPWFGEPYRNFFDLVLKGLFIHPGHKACTKTYGFVGNIVRQLESLLTVPSRQIQGKCFYLGDAPPLNISEWADQIRLAYNGKPNLRLPFPIMVLLAAAGDGLKAAGIKFPMTSFRLKNMTTDNVVNLEHLMSVTGRPQFSTEEGIRLTLEWLAKKHQPSPDLQKPA